MRFPHPGTFLAPLLLAGFSQSAFPQSAPTDSQAWSAVLQVAEERGAAADAAGLKEEAATLRADIAASKDNDPAVMARAHTEAPWLVLFRPLHERTNNPVRDRLVAQTISELKRPDPSWPQATAESPVFTGIDGAFGTRSAANRMRQYLWLYAHPDSPLRGNPELLRRFLRRAHAFVDAYELFDQQGAKRPEVYDFFAVKDACGGLTEFLTAYPGLLLPSQKAAWERTLGILRDHLWNGDPLDQHRGALKALKPWNINQELARMTGLASLACYFGDETMLAKVRSHVDQVLAKQFPDGAFPYNGSGNPSNNYHDEVLLTLARLYDLTGYEPIREGLRRAQWKGPVMGRTEEFWTSPYFKTFRWNTSNTTESGCEAVAALSGNGFVRWMLDRDRAASRSVSRDDVVWYRGDINPRPLPDRYTILDRNVGGPRAWYGTFSYAGTFRAPPDREAGHETLMGAMTVDAADGRVNSILVNISPRVRVREADEPPTTSKGASPATAWARQTTELHGLADVARNFSVCSAAYSLSSIRLGAYQGPVSDWKVRQLWLGLPDRIIGLLSTVPAHEKARALEVATVFRFISGGTAGASRAKQLESLGAGKSRYGELDLVVHEQNFAEAVPEVLTYRRPNFPAWEMSYRTLAANQKENGSPWPADAEFYMIAEVGPNTSPRPPAKVQRLRIGPLLALDVEIGMKRYRLCFNPTPDPVTVPPAVDWPSSSKTSLRLFEAGGADAPRMIATPEELVLPPGAQAVWVSSPDETDHLPGWPSFEKMVAEDQPR